MAKSIRRKQKKRVVRRSSSRRETRGVSKMLIIAVVAIILAGAGGFYFLGQKSGIGGSLPLMKPALNPNCKYNDAELCKFMNNWHGQANYAVATTSNLGGFTIDALYEFAGEDKYHSVTKQNGKESSNIISIGDSMYTLDYSDNKWWKQTFKAEESQEENKVKNEFKFDDKEVEDKTTYKFVAKESCGDRMCFKYEIVSPESTETKQFIWFDDHDYLMRKMRIEDPSGGYSESVFTYNSISVSAPSPVKEGTPGIQSGAPAGYSEQDVQKMMKQYEQNPDSQPNYEEPPAEDTSSSE